MANQNEAAEAEESVRQRVRKAAERALAEAAARGQAQVERPATRELDGRGGKEPVRYGDWEVKGRAVDF